MKHYAVYTNQDDGETAKGLTIEKAFEIVSILMPIITFLAFDDPHDCFKCFGKDPDRNYSRY